MASETRSNTQEIQQQALSEKLRSSVLPLWQSQFTHPFVTALGSGELPTDNFQFYICQDALFLDDLTKVFALAVTKTSRHDEMEQFGQYALDTLLVEADLHRRYGERFGLTPTQMANVPMAPTNYAYTRHLLTIANNGTLPEIATAVLPCAWIYAEIGQNLTRTSPSTSHPYFDWLATYANPDFDKVGRWLRACLDNYATELSSAQIARLYEIFHISTCYEWMFWQMAWQLEKWPS